MDNRNLAVDLWELSIKHKYGCFVSVCVVQPQFYQCFVSDMYLSLYSKLPSMTLRNGHDSYIGCYIILKVVAKIDKGLFY